MVTGERKTVVDNAGAARYVSTGHLLYAREGVLFARRFDPVRLESGEAVLSSKVSGDRLLWARTP